MGAILTWLNEHIGLEGTIVFAFIAFVTSLVIKSIIGVFKSIFFKKDDWCKKAGELKDKLHSIQKEYHDFKNSLSRKQLNLPENRKRLQSLQDRIKFAKQQRKKHLASKKQKNKFLLPIIIFIISVIIFVYAYF